MSTPERTPPGELPGALVISLDFELHWGVRDHKRADGPYRRWLLGVWEVVPALLDLFAREEIAATWATVGMLFARSRAELLGAFPDRRPRYHDPALDPYGEAVGEGEDDDPLHYAPSLVERIRRTPRQEIASHTFSHYYCLEPGQDREDFAADLRSAVSIAAGMGVQLRSIVFPRNQHNRAYDDMLVDAGILALRGNAGGWMYRGSGRDAETWLKRGARFLDAHLPLSGRQTIRWAALREGPVCNVPASHFVRPVVPGREWLTRVHLARLSASIRHAARSREIVHLWWHPHNFGAAPEANLEMLRRIVAVYRECRDRHGMRSLTMVEAARLARSGNE